MLGRVDKYLGIIGMEGKGDVFSIVANSLELRITNREE